MTPTVTLAMVDMLGDADALRVLRHCHRVMPPGFFSDIVMFSPSMVDAPSLFRHVPVHLLECPPGKRQLYGVWRLREMPRWINTDFYMMVHRDGYILNPEKWTDEFLDYDYIGAPWNAVEIGGNSAFHIRSRSFAMYLANIDVPYRHDANEDIFICRDLAGKIDQKFMMAPFSLSLKFSLESPIDGYPRTTADVFGFHGKHILPLLPKLP